MKRGILSAVAAGEVYICGCWIFDPLNRINTYIIIFISIALTFLVVYVYVNERFEEEPETIFAPLKVEAYRVDRYPLPGADIYLNQKFIGKTDDKGFFNIEVSLVVGESYTLRIEKERDGYIYEPWETHFKIAEEKRKQKEKKELIQEEVESLEGEFDVLTELERAQLGRVSLYEKYHFLAILDGSMLYTIKVSGKNSAAVRDATIIVNGKVEGKTDKTGTFVVRYSGEDLREENIQIFKEGEHLWMNSVEIYPDARLNVELNKMLLIDLYTYTESYDVIEGIAGSEVYLGNNYLGKTGNDGYFNFKYVNESGVDGYLALMIRYPEGYYPEKLQKTYYISEDLPKLSVSHFAFRKTPVSPKIAVMPLRRGNPDDVLLLKRSKELKTKIEDYLAVGGTFTVVPSRSVRRLFYQFDLDIKESGMNWGEIPLIKKEVDGIIFGELHNNDHGIDVKLYGVDYTGELIGEIRETMTLRELQSLPENFVNLFKSNFPFEGTITAIDKKVYINLGKRHGVEKEDRFYSFFNYYDDIKRDYSKKRTAKLKIVDTGEVVSAGDLESISEGFLLEAGSRVKRVKEPAKELRQLPVTIVVTSGRKPVTGANVYLDDLWSGQTDDGGKLRISLRESTFADVLIYKDGYIPTKIGVNVKENVNTFHVDLKRGKTSFTIDSEPQGAPLFVNGEYKGTTPVVKKPVIIPFGFHLVELKLEGYKEFKQYMKFSQKKLSLTGDKRIQLYEDYYQDAENAYVRGEIEKAISILETIPLEHPDSSKAMEFLGFIYLNDVKDYKLALGYYHRVLDLDYVDRGAGHSLISYYNMGQAYYNVAESLFYEDGLLSQQYYSRAIASFNIVLERKNRIPVAKRRTVYQNGLFYISVCYQKLYYHTGIREYLSRAYDSWVDYFDFFDKNFLEDNYFQKQYDVAESYREEAKRLKVEE